ncbi:MAG: GtrA family protein [Kiritimatiellae bacterium]|nr:GtrA family protein [Kiritimatiellia bacterium]
MNLNLDIKRCLSHEAGPFMQLVKYGIVGVMATCVQTGVFYVLAATWLKCLNPDDWAVKFMGLPSVEVSDSVRACRFAVATSLGFILANIFCWLMNRWFVFKPGRFRWYVEFGMFVGSATLATVIALGVSSALIRYAGMMTTLAVVVEVVVSFLVNYFIRKFFIFKG